MIRLSDAVFSKNSTPSHLLGSQNPPPPYVPTTAALGAQWFTLYMFPLRRIMVVSLQVHASQRCSALVVKCMQTQRKSSSSSPDDIISQLLPSGKYYQL